MSVRLSPVSVCRSRPRFYHEEPGFCCFFLLFPGKKSPIHPKRITLFFPDLPIVKVRLNNYFASLTLFFAPMRTVAFLGSVPISALTGRGFVPGLYGICCAWPRSPSKTGGFFFLFLRGWAYVRAPNKNFFYILRPACVDTSIDEALI